MDTLSSIIVVTLLLAANGFYEEIVGDIQDETDSDEPSTAVTVIDDTHWEADGLISLSDLERSVGLKIDDQLDANTLSGLFMQRLARMPETGDEITENNYQLRVLNNDDHRVGKVYISYQKVASDEDENLTTENNAMQETDTEQKDTFDSDTNGKN